jgi:ribonuclease HI
MAGRKYYAVAVGFKPGIYDDWPAAQAQVSGFKGAVYKGFKSRGEAVAWMKSPSYAPTAGKRRPRQATPQEVASPRVGEVAIYTDGGARFNPGPGGYGIVRIQEGERREFSGGYRLTTNNRMELMGCIVALRGLECRDKPVTLYSDSSYVVNGITRGWAARWKRNGWVKADRKKALNPDLWADLLDLVEGLNITFKWVKGHAGHPENERCDELAVAAAAQDSLPEDDGYRGAETSARKEGRGNRKTGRSVPVSGDRR